MTQETTTIPNSTKTKTTKTTKTSSFTVFWLEEGKAQCEIFITNLANPALEFCEHLRKLAKEGAPITHVCISPDMVDNVGGLGVSDKLPDDYNWTMRRKEFVPGRPSRNTNGANGT